jgi:hypothetical protein
MRRCSVDSRGATVLTMAVTFTIQIDDAGKLGISGPLEDKIFCLGLLEAAKDAVRQFSEKRPLIAPVSVIPNLTPKKVG